MTLFLWCCLINTMFSLAKYLAHLTDNKYPRVTTMGWHGPSYAKFAANDRGSVIYHLIVLVWVVVLLI